jgi:hypothetical protein
MRIISVKSYFDLLFIHLLFSSCDPLRFGVFMPEAEPSTLVAVSAAIVCVQHT